MIALSREHDVAEVLALASSGPAIVGMKSLSDRLGWVQDRLEDALADAEEAGDIQSLESPEGELVCCLTPIGAERLGVKLDRKSRWIPRGEEERPFRIAHARTEEVADEGKLALTPANEPQAWFRAHVYETAAKLLQIPRFVFVGDGNWPLRDTAIVEIPIGDEKIRDLVVTGSHCPVCGRARLDRTETRGHCCVCERWRRTEQAKPQPKSKRPTKSYIRFRPRTRGARKVQEV